jgi:type IV secretory pathway protease TraF
MKGSLTLRMLVIAVALIAVAMFGLAPTSPAHASEPYVKIHENAMAPTVVSGSTVEFDPHSYSHSQPKVGDLIVYHLPWGLACAQPPLSGSVCDTPETEQAEKAEKHKAEREAETQESETAFAEIRKFEEEVQVARVSAIPGDRVSISDGRVVRNGQPETYLPVAVCPHYCNLRTPVTIPPRHYFLTVNNRSYSDSRVWGPVRLGLIVGRVVEIRPPGAPSAKPIRGSDLVIAIVGGVLLVIVVTRTRVNWPQRTPEVWLGPLDAGITAISFFIGGFAFQVLWQVAVVHGEIDPTAETAVLIAAGIIAPFALLIHHEPFVVKGRRGIRGKAVSCVRWRISVRRHVYRLCRHRTRTRHLAGNPTHGCCRARSSIFGAECRPGSFVAPDITAASWYSSNSGGIARK